MTICVGMLATDGIVIAADALESGTYLSRPVQKIMTWRAHNPNAIAKDSAACVVAGAGDGGFIDAFTMELIDGVSGDMTMTDFESHVRETLRSFYATHVAPALYVNVDHDFRVLIGAAFGMPNPRMFLSYKSTLRPVTELCTSIGIGCEYANQWKDFFPFSDVRHTELSAAAIVSRVKECVRGCGKYTDIVSLHNHQIIPDETCGSRLIPPNELIHHVPSVWISQWEQSFSTVWKAKQANLYAQLIEDTLKPLTHQRSEDQQQPCGGVYQQTGPTDPGD